MNGGRRRSKGEANGNGMVEKEILGYPYIPNGRPSPSLRMGPPVECKSQNGSHIRIFPWFHCAFHKTAFRHYRFLCTQHPHIALLLLLYSSFLPTGSWIHHLLFFFFPLNFSFLFIFWNSYLLGFSPLETILSLVFFYGSHCLRPLHPLFFFLSIALERWWLSRP